jgi:hypothetical protein
MEAVGQHTRNRLVHRPSSTSVFNTPGFDRHARIKDTELGRVPGPGLRRTWQVETLGYGSGATKGYYRNLFYNPGFELGLSGWEAEGAVQSTPTGVLCAGRGHPSDRRSLSVTTSGQSPQIDICVWGLQFAGRHGHALRRLAGRQGPRPERAAGIARELRRAPAAGGRLSRDIPGRRQDVSLEGAVFNSHTEVAGLYDVEDRQTALRDMIVHSIER